MKTALSNQKFGNHTSSLRARKSPANIALLFVCWPYLFSSAATNTMPAACIICLSLILHKYARIQNKHARNLNEHVRFPNSVLVCMENGRNARFVHFLLQFFQCLTHNTRRYILAVLFSVFDLSISCFREKIALTVLIVLRSQIAVVKPTSIALKLLSGSNI